MNPDEIIKTAGIAAQLVAITEKYMREVQDVMTDEGYNSSRPLKVNTPAMKRVATVLMDHMRIVRTEATSLITSTVMGTDKPDTRPGFGHYADPQG